MADDITITIGASIADLNEALDSAKEAIKSLGEALGVSLTVAGFLEFVNSMEEIGVQAMRASQMLGLTVEQVSALNAAARLSGGDSQQMTVALERLAFSMQQAAAGGQRQQEAFQRLGITYRDTNGQLLPLDTMLAKIANRFATMPDGPAKTALAIDLFSRAGANMIPMLNKGADGLAELEEKARAAGAVLDPQTTSAMLRADESSSQLRLSLTGLGEAIFAKLAPAITQTTNQMRSSIDAMTDWIKSSENLSRVINFLNGGWVDLAKNAIAFHAGVTIAQVGVNMLVDAMRNASNETMRLGDEWVNLDAKLTGGAAKKTDAPPPFNKEGLKLAAVNAQDAIRLIDAVYKQESEATNEAFKNYQLTEKQKTAALIAEINTREDQTLAALRIEAAAVQHDPVEYKKTLDKIDLLYVDSATKRQKAIMDEQHAELSGMVQLGNAIGSAFSSQLNGLLAGTTSFGAAMKAVFAKLVEEIIAELLELAAVEAVVFAFTGGFGSVGSLGSGMLGSLGKLLNFDSGTPYVTQSGLAVIHQGEAIVPAEANPFAPGGGVTNNMGGNVSLNISAIDGRSVANMFFNNRAFMQQMLNLLARNNPSNASRLVGSV